MQWNLSEVLGYRVHARDGSLGFVTDLYVDDMYWKVRYLVVTGDEQAGARKFVLAPETISRIDREIGWMSVLLSIDTVRDSPVIATGGHILWREESKLRAYYGLPNYRSGLSASRKAPQAHTVGSPRLHSLKELLGCSALTDIEEEAIGPLVDLVFDDRTWTVHSLEVDTSSWLPADRVWLRPDDIKQVRGIQKQLTLNIPLAVVLDRPKVDQPLLMASAWEPTPQAATHCASQLHAWCAAT